MVYVYECDGWCEKEEIRNERPALTAEFNEDWYDEGRAGDQLLQQGYEAADLITLCPNCTLRLLLREGLEQR